MCSKLLLVPLLAMTACDEAEIDEFRSTANPWHALHGTWEGLSTHVVDSPDYDHETRIVIQNSAHVTHPFGIFARYEYPNQNGAVCNSTLHEVPGTTGFYVFDDVTSSFGCVNGTVTLAATADPNIIDFQWITLSGDVENEGPLYRVPWHNSGGGAG